METNRVSSSNQTDETDDARETDPCLMSLSSRNNLRKSMESLNKNRENEQNSSVLDSEKNKNNDNVNSYNMKQDKKKTGIKTVKFNHPPSKFETWCSEKTGLSRLGLLVVGVLILILFILFLTVLIMSLLWPNISHSMMFPMCRRPACLIASSEIISKMNQNVNPCEDIREYSCGQWMLTDSIPKNRGSWNLKKKMQLKHREELRDLITTTIYPKDVELFEWRLKNIYDSCMSVGTIETESNRPLMKIITTLGGWQVLKQFSIQSFDFKKTLKLLHAKYNIQPFFSVEVVPDAKSPQQSIIQISPGSLGLPDRSYYYRKSDDKVVQAYKVFVKDVAQTLGATSTDASVFADDLFGFEKRLADRFPSRLPDRNAHYRRTIAELEDLAPSVPLYDILSFMFPDAKLTMKSEVVVLASDHLVNVSGIISNTDRSALNNYMMWRLAVGYLPYLSQIYRDTISVFHKHLYGTKENTPRWEMCIETLQKFVGYGMEAMLESRKPDADEKAAVVRELFETIRQTIKDAVQTSNSLPQHIQEHFLDKLNTISIQVGLPAPMRHLDNFNKFYISLTPIKDDFFQNILFGTSFLQEEQQRRLTNPLEEHRWMDIVSDGQLKVVYIPEINRVIVPMALLSLPYFHPNFPLSVLYGNIGMELGLAILGSISGRGVFHAGDGIILPPDHPAHNGSHDCFLTDSGPYSGAVKQVFTALKNVLSSMSHIHQPALEYLEDEAIFFISYAQAICTMKTPETQDLDLTTLKTKLDDHSVLHMLARKSKQFSETFSCTKILQSDPCDSII